MPKSNPTAEEFLMCLVWGPDEKWEKLKVSDRAQIRNWVNTIKKSRRREPVLRRAEFLQDAGRSIRFDRVALEHDWRATYRARAPQKGHGNNGASSLTCASPF